MEIQPKSLCGVVLRHLETKFEPQSMVNGQTNSKRKMIKKKKKKKKTMTKKYWSGFAVLKTNRRFEDDAEAEDADVRNVSAKVSRLERTLCFVICIARTDASTSIFESPRTSSLSLCMKIAKKKRTSKIGQTPTSKRLSLGWEVN